MYLLPVVLWGLSVGNGSQQVGYGWTFSAWENICYVHMLIYFFPCSQDLLVSCEFHQSHSDGLVCIYACISCCQILQLIDMTLFSAACIRLLFCTPERHRCFGASPCILGSFGAKSCKRYSSCTWSLGKLVEDLVWWSCFCWFFLSH